MQLKTVCSDKIESDDDFDDFRKDKGKVSWPVCQGKNITKLEYCDGSESKCQLKNGICNCDTGRFICATQINPCEENITVVQASQGSKSPSVCITALCGDCLLVPHLIVYFMELYVSHLSTFVLMLRNHPPNSHQSHHLYVELPHIFLNGIPNIY